MLSRSPEWRWDLCVSESPRSPYSGSNARSLDTLSSTFQCWLHSCPQLLDAGTPWQHQAVHLPNNSWTTVPSLLTVALFRSAFAFFEVSTTSTVPQLAVDSSTIVRCGRGQICTKQMVCQSPIQHLQAKIRVGLNAWLSQHRFQTCT